jgi:hypothetical protein
MALWENNCGATQKTCNGMNYYGGYGECAQGHTFWRHYDMPFKAHPGANQITLTGRVWTIDSWDGEQFTVEMQDASGNVLDSVTRQGNNFAHMADQTV